MEEQEVIFSRNLHREVKAAIHACRHDNVFVLTDENTRRLCLPLLTDMDCLQDAQHMTIEAGEEHKTLDSVCHVWSELQRMGATRHSLLLNVGGGMVTDLGGFAASTFKRGIPYINVPTTLLSMVDASVGGKTGFNYGGLKNEIGVFSNARTVILDTTFLRTLDHENLLSGYAEMLKHALLADEYMWAELLRGELLETPEALSDILKASVGIKQGIVKEDPLESGLRKALNLGHTAGHAFEALALERTPILHGYAVAYGLIVELYLSVVKTGFPSDVMRQTVRFILDHYGRMPITCDDYPRLLELMHHDKKNEGTAINVTLLGRIGHILYNRTATEEEMTEALDFYREC